MHRLLDRSGAASGRVHFITSPKPATSCIIGSFASEAAVAGGEKLQKLHPVLKFDCGIRSGGLRDLVVPTAKAPDRRRNPATLSEASGTSGCSGEDRGPRAAPMTGFNSIGRMASGPYEPPMPGPVLEPPRPGCQNLPWCRPPPASRNSAAWSSPSPPGQLEPSAEGWYGRGPRQLPLLGQVIRAARDAFSPTSLVTTGGQPAGRGAVDGGQWPPQQCTPLAPNRRKAS